MRLAPVQLLPVAPLLLAIPRAACAETVAVTSVEHPIRVDGRLDEAEWALATPVTDFKQHGPAPGGPPRGTVEVRVLQDSRTLYFGVRLTGAPPSPPATLAPRDDVPDRRFNVVISSNQDLSTAVVLGVNALGRQEDFLWHNGDWNLEYDVLFSSAGRETDDGYEIELAVPFRSLPYEGGGEQDWRILLLPDDPAIGANYSFPHVSDNAWFGDPELMRQFGATLRGVRPPEPGIGVQVTGTLTGVQTAARDEDGALSWSGLDPWYDAVRPSAELVLSLTPTVELALVGNPDFSDVESDETQFDLNERFTWRRTERRDFFIADATHFTDELDTLYTRGVVQPVYGTRFAGTAASASFGVLQVLDRAPGWSLDWNGTPGWDDDDVEGAMAATTFARARARLGGADLGLLAADKRLIGGSGSTNTVSGLDLRLPMTPTLVLAGGAQASTTTDADDLAREGHRASLTLARPSGPGLRWQVAAQDISQDFRAETAFLTDTGLSRVDAYLERPFDGQGRLDRVQPRVGGYLRVDRDGETWEHEELSQELSLSGVHKVKTTVESTHLRLDAGDSGRMWKGTLSYSQASSATLTAAASGSVGQDWSWAASAVAFGSYDEATLTWRPVYNVFLSVTAAAGVSVPEGADLEHAATLRAKGTWQVLPWAGLRIIEEVGDNTSWNERWLSSSALVHLQARVRTEAWLGYSERRDLLAGESEEHTVFFKLSGDWIH